MKNQETMPFNQSLRLDVGHPHNDAVATERTNTIWMMIGSVVGAVLITMYCRSFLDSQPAMAMGMIGAVVGAMLASLITPTSLAFARRHGHAETARRR